MHRAPWYLLLGVFLALPPLALAAATGRSLEVQTLAPASAPPAAAEVTRGTLDRGFGAPASLPSLPQLRGT
ncbi:MAG TPA: hypothetical protein VMD06_07080, partial [Steroidobacteraceae bacterium]|nr:hypothetical protein [Steroidobacteraceae bacterium]